MSSITVFVKLIALTIIILIMILCEGYLTMGNKETTTKIQYI